MGAGIFFGHVRQGGKYKHLNLFPDARPGVEVSLDMIRPLMIS